MSKNLHLFFDFDDTLSDFASLGQQYVDNLSSILSSELGSSIEQWQAAIPPALQAAVGRYLERFRGKALSGYNEWLLQERERIVADVFQRAGKDPLKGECAVELAIMLQDRALRRCNALFDGADSALRLLDDRGFRLFMASSQESRYLRAALTGAPCFHDIEEFYGPDLIDCAKEGSEFYERVFDAVGIEPGQAVVIDDQVMCLEWAYDVGAHVIQARMRNDPEPVVADLYCESFEELPAIVETLAETGTLTEDVGIRE